MAMDDSVGFTKNPVHPTAMATAIRATTDRSLRLQLRMQKPLNEGLHSLRPESAHKIVAEEFAPTIGTCTNV
jgi:hypothetical protein